MAARKKKPERAPRATCIHFSEDQGGFRQCESEEVVPGVAYCSHHLDVLFGVRIAEDGGTPVGLFTTRDFVQNEEVCPYGGKIEPYASRTGAHRYSIPLHTDGSTAWTGVLGRGELSLGSMANTIANRDGESDVARCNAHLSTNTSNETCLFITRAIRKEDEIFLDMSRTYAPVSGTRPLPERKRAAAGSPSGTPSPDSKRPARICAITLCDKLPNTGSNFCGSHQVTLQPTAGSPARIDAGPAAGREEDVESGNTAGAPPQQIQPAPGGGKKVQRRMGVTNLGPVTEGWISFDGKVRDSPSSTIAATLPTADRRKQSIPRKISTASRDRETGIDPVRDNLQAIRRTKDDQEAGPVPGHSRSRTAQPAARGHQAAYPLPEKADQPNDPRLQVVRYPLWMAGEAAKTYTEPPVHSLSPIGVYFTDITRRNGRETAFQAVVNALTPSLLRNRFELVRPNIYYQRCIFVHVLHPEEAHNRHTTDTTLNALQFSEADMAFNEKLAKWCIMIDLVLIECLPAPEAILDEDTQKPLAITRAKPWVDLMSPIIPEDPEVGEWDENPDGDLGTLRDFLESKHFHWISHLHVTCDNYVYAFWRGEPWSPTQVLTLELDNPHDVLVDMTAADSWCSNTAITRYEEDMKELLDRLQETKDFQKMVTDSDISVWEEFVGYKNLEKYEKDSDAEQAADIAKFFLEKVDIFNRQSGSNEDDDDDADAIVQRTTVTPRGSKGDNPRSSGTRELMTLKEAQHALAEVYVRCTEASTASDTAYIFKNTEKRWPAFFQQCAKFDGYFCDPAKVGANKNELRQCLQAALRLFISEQLTVEHRVIIELRYIRYMKHFKEYEFTPDYALHINPDLLWVEAGGDPSVSDCPVLSFQVTLANGTQTWVGAPDQSANPFHGCYTAYKIGKNMECGDYILPRPTTLASLAFLRNTLVEPTQKSKTVNCTMRPLFIPAAWKLYQKLLKDHKLEDKSFPKTLSPRGGCSDWLSSSIKAPPAAVAATVAETHPLTPTRDGLATWLSNINHVARNELRLTQTANEFVTWYNTGQVELAMPYHFIFTLAHSTTLPNDAMPRKKLLSWTEYMLIDFYHSRHKMESRVVFKHMIDLYNRACEADEFLFIEFYMDLLDLSTAWPLFTFTPKEGGEVRPDLNENVLRQIIHDLKPTIWYNGTHKRMDKYELRSAWRRQFQDP